jgi:hypothetical protein
MKPGAWSGDRLHDKRPSALIVVARAHSELPPAGEFNLAASAHVTEVGCTLSVDAARSQQCGEKTLKRCSRTVQRTQSGACAIADDKPLSCYFTVGDEGFEPATSSVSGKRSPPELIARPALVQVRSYTIEKRRRRVCGESVGAFSRWQAGRSCRSSCASRCSALRRR